MMHLLAGGGIESAPTYEPLQTSVSNTVAYITPTPMHDPGYSGADVVATLIAVVIGAVIFGAVVKKMPHA